ncbi:uncharacterized protein ACR2FA_009763 [Aphomia sociella]
MDVIVKWKVGSENCVSIKDLKPVKKGAYVNKKDSGEEPLSHLVQNTIHILPDDEDPFQDIDAEEFNDPHYVISPKKRSDSMLPKLKGTWLKLCRNLKKIVLISQHHPETYEYFRSYPAVVAERQRQLLEGGAYLIHPFSLFWRYLRRYGTLPTGYASFLNANDGNIAAVPLCIRYKKGIFISFCAFFVFFIKIYFTAYSSTLRYHELMNQVEQYMRHKQFPAPLKKRVITFYNYNFQEKYYKEDASLDYLSEQLRNEITLHTCHKLVNKVALFDGLSATVVGSVLGCLTPEVYLPDDLVVRAGDIGDCMYFIANGTVAVYSLKGVEVCHLEDGAHFGEVALLMKDSKRVASVVAIEITQVYRLDATDFRHFVMTNEELHERVQSLASQRMHETVVLDDEFKSKQNTAGSLSDLPGQ